MKFLRYGIQLERLEARHLEMVRRWRNQDAVRLRMQYRGEISPEAQTEWFRKLDYHTDWYFVATQQASPFGLFHIKAINWEKKSGESGGFVGDPTLIGGIEPGLAILALMDFAFFILGIETLEAKYYPGYREIAMLNRQLGYEVFAVESDGFVRARVSADRYLQTAAQLRKAAERLQETASRLTSLPGLHNT